MEENIPKIPISFSEVVGEDSRFTRVKIVVAHDGENTNCIFPLKVIESLKEQLENIPILAIVKENDDGDIDFDNHGNKLLRVDNKLKSFYVGHAYGFIPKDNNAVIEELYGNDGIKRNYLVCEGLIWNKFKHIVDMLGDKKGQSMELSAKESFGKLNDDGVFVYEKALIDGVCILGDHVNSAMNNAFITTQFSESNIMNDVKNMISEYCEFSEKRKEVYEVAKEKDEKELELEESKEVESEKEETKESKKDKKPKSFSKEDEEEKSKDDDSEKEETKEDEKEDEKEKETNFSETPTQFSVDLSHTDKRTLMFKALMLADIDGYVIEMYDTYAIVNTGDYDADDIWTSRTLKVDYTVDELGGIVLGERVEVHSQYLTLEEVQKVNAEREHIKSLKSELESLTLFKSKIELDERVDYLSNFSEKLSVENFSKLKESLSDFSDMEGLKREVAYCLFSQTEGTEKEEKPLEFSSDNVSVQAVSDSDNLESSPFGEATKFFYNK